MKQCGGCTECCTLLGIDELGKLRGDRCPHELTGMGCGVYSTRPPSCRNFSCLWLLRDDMPEDSKPNECGVVLVNFAKEPMLIVAYSAQPFGWTVQPIRGILNQFRLAGYTVLCRHENRNWVFRQDTSEKRPVGA